MKYRLGLDLGVGSVGSAVIELDENNQAKEVIDAGVRIFEVSEGAENRRLKRIARKNLIRTRKRLELLAQKLFENHLWVNDTPEGTDKLKSKSPYKIRRDALYDRLANQNYVGRAILHLAKHRGAGFVSAGEEMAEETLEEEPTPKTKSSPYDIMVQHLKKTNSLTIGEFFYKRLQNKEQKTIRQKEYALKNHIVDYAIPRYLVKDEFNKIWDEQAQYFPQMQKEGLKQEIYDILFYERPAAPYAAGTCIYFNNEKRLLKAHPLAEMRRIYEETNNIRIMDDMQKRKLTLAERNKIVNELLLNGQNAGKKKIKEVLGLSAQQKVSLADDRVIGAYLYSRPEFAENEYIRKLNEEQLSEFAEFLAEPINPQDAHGRLYNEDQLICHLQKQLKIEDEKVVGALLTKLPKGRGTLGKTATTIILEKLKQNVLTHREITDELAKTDARFMAEEEKARHRQGKCSALPYYGEILANDTQPLPPLLIKHNKDKLDKDEMMWGKIANPAVHMILNQIRLVVNEIVKIYGKPYEINIELGRDVGLSAQKKKELEQRQKKNENTNKEAKNYLQDYRLPLNNQNILKFKLAKEQAWKDAYNPGKDIPRDFAGMEIEHIIPQSRGGTDAFCNLCLVSRNDNLNKGDKFAYEFFAETKTPEEIREILKNARSRFPKEKSWRFEADAGERFEDNGDEDETNRYLTDTRYVAKMAARYLRAIVDCNDSDEVIRNRILTVKGRQTSELRKRWNLFGLEYNLMGLEREVPRYINCAPYWVELNTGEIYEGTDKPDIDGNWKFFDKKKNEEWQPKPRIDHRHHAIDAITVACVTRSLIKKISNENELRHIEYPLPLTSVASTADFRRKVLSVLKEVKVSHKPDHGKAGQFHEETGKRILRNHPDDDDIKITVYSRKVLQVLKSKKDLNKLLVSSSVKDEWSEKIAEDRKKQEKLVANFNLYMDTAKQVLLKENERAETEGKKGQNITESRIIIKAFQIIKDKGLWTGDKFKCYECCSAVVIIPKYSVVFKSGNNHRVDFYEKNGKIGWEVINRFNANKNDFVPQWRQEGGKIIWSVQQGDLLELDTPEEWQGYTDKERCIAKVKKFSDGKMVIDYFTDARMTSPQDKNLKYMFVDSLEKGLSYFTIRKTRKIELTPFGRIKKKHKVLWYGKKATA